MNAKPGLTRHVWPALLTLVLGLAAAPSVAAESGSYGYIRTLEGSATLMQAGSGDRDQAEINQPLLAGDRLVVPERSRLELVLADRNLLRVDGGTELQLERLAGSPDSNDRATVLRLHEGNLQLVVLQDSLGEELPRIETSSATIYVQHYGVYRVTADRNGWSEVLVRRGKAEVVTDRGTANVRADERAVIDSQWASVDVGAATGFDTLERWASRLDEDFDADDRYVDDDLRYAAAPLSRHGSWIEYGSRRYWRPRVAADWRPYWQGRWAYTPSGLTWVSYEPWGWVPYHYGSWDFLPGYGWAWQPGYVYSPAWVYWYWGPGYASWCPTGLYTGFYGPRFGHGYGFHRGVYGWAGGGWDHWNHWNWMRTEHIGRRDQHRYAVPIDELRGRLRQVPRGIVTTDTQGLKPDTWRDQGRVARVLMEKPNRANSGRELTDVTPFIQRKPELPPTVARTVIDEKPLHSLDGTPLRPSTLGRRPAGGRMDTPVARIDSDKPRPAGEKPRPQEVGGAERPAREARGGVSRPAPGTDGGAPRPERSARGTVDEKPAAPGIGGQRPSRPATGDVERPADERPAMRGGERPARPEATEPADDAKPSRGAVRRPEPRDEEAARPSYRRPEPAPEPAPAPVPDEKPAHRPSARETSPPPTPTEDSGTSSNSGDNEDRSPRRIGGNDDSGTGYDKPSRRPPTRSADDSRMQMQRMSMPERSRPQSRPAVEPMGRSRTEALRSYSRPQVSRPSSRPETTRPETTQPETTRRDEPSSSRRSIEPVRPSVPRSSERPRVEAPSRPPSVDRPSADRPSASTPRTSSGDRSGGNRGSRGGQARETNSSRGRGHQ